MERMYDNLTGLALGAGLGADMDALIAKGDEFSFIAFDIDNFLSVNRDYGHKVGDEVLKMIAAKIKEVFQNPTIGYRASVGFRVGGDEMAVLLPGINRETAFLKAEEMRMRVQDEKLDYTTADGTVLKQTISMGVSSFPEDGSRPADICRRADSAMVRAKKNGRNQVCLAREEKLLPKTSHYTQAQLEKLSLTAEKLNAGESALLREALDDLIKKYDI